MQLIVAMFLLLLLCNTTDAHASIIKNYSSKQIYLEISNLLQSTLSKCTPLRTRHERALIEGVHLYNFIKFHVIFKKIIFYYCLSVIILYAVLTSQTAVRYRDKTAATRTCTAKTA
ncbi:hypothetical protein C1646_133597 [Rhizophagus diaphanus]|nr:hypothetical protein C1646_133597 [Rhizophagus diaphanus] [Rhizophagus sp. MUCL 43196]